MTTTPTSRTLRPEPPPPTRATVDPSRQGLLPEEVPSRLDALGRPTEAVVPVSRVAATHWCETSWVRA